MKSVFPMYILQVIDNGILQDIISEVDLAFLAEIAEEKITNYLQRAGARGEGDVAYRTEDGYAVIQNVPSDPAESPTSIWTYRFDGQEEVSDSLSAIRGQILRMNSKLLVISEDVLRRKVLDAVSDFCGFSIKDPEDPSRFTNQDGVVLANTNFSKITEPNNGLFREWGC
ncbi:hypothetical protein JI735_34435 (plasmid) [Paenibacillus sonchi]|uniref:Uncharacterized protein n=1 Tax=Paenibacillus sonchi TaxID=373687 RepID=A0A974PIX1_9BACL|nr:hypothetical protein [Paenibacillus sonchi]QQZ64535.1 hypothetical protein JI735_34435 [Paenibacillus sonchi]